MRAISTAKGVICSCVLTKNDNAEMLEKFYAMSKGPTAVDYYGFSGVLLTVTDDGTSEERLAFLESKGFDLTVSNNRGQSTLLMLMAPVSDEAEGIEALLARGFVVNGSDNAGITPLILALSEKEPEVIDALLDASANADVTKAKGVTPLLAALARGDDFGPVIDKLITAGADLTAQDAKDGTALTYAVKGSQPAERLQQIIDAGVNLDAKDGEETTAVMHAALQSKSPEVIEFLLAAGADKSITDMFDDAAAQMAMDNAALKASDVIAKLQ